MDVLASAPAPLLNKSKAERTKWRETAEPLLRPAAYWDLLVGGAAGIRDLHDLRNRERLLRRAGTAGR